MVELHSNVNGKRSHSFPVTSTINEVFQYFFAIRSGAPATKDEMEEYVIVNFTNTTEPLPLSSTILDCGLVDQSRVESKLLYDLIFE